jgi:hypothetical protein
MLSVRDYDRDGFDNLIVTKDDKVDSFNGFVTKETDYP